MTDETLFAGGAPGGQHLVRFTRRMAVQRWVRLAQRAVDIGPSGWVERGRRLWAGPSATATPIIFPSVQLAALRAALEQRWLVAPSAAATVARKFAESGREAGALHAAAATIQMAGADVYGARVPLCDGALDWSVDPTTGTPCWTDTPLDEEAAIAAAVAAPGTIDVKRVWELGRQQYLAPLALSGLITGDETRRALACACVASWLEQCSAGRGIQWASPLEIALRAISWLWTMPLLLDAPALRPVVAQQWAMSLGAHYATLRARLSIHADPTNHLIGEATALWLLATVFPDLPGAGDERRRTTDLLEEQVIRQVAVDGVSEEQASGYHAFVLEFLLQIIAVGRRTGTVVPMAIGDRAGAMVEVLDALLGRGGDMPQIGDWDDGRAMPCFGAEDWRSRAEGLVALGAALLGVAVRRRVSPAPGLVGLMMGAPAPVTREREVGSCLFGVGGLAVCESSTPSGGTVQALMRVGGFGALVNGGHAHADILSVLVRVNDQLLLGDPGSGSYTGDARVRETFRSTLLHNTITVDGLSQADPLGTFKWINKPAARRHGWFTDARLDWVGASHDGYTRLRQPVWHRRDLLHVRGEYVLLVDRMLGHGRHQLTRRFIVPPSVRAGIAGSGHADITGAGGVGLQLVIGDEPAAVLTVITVPWSSGYGRWQETVAVEAQCELALPVTLVTAFVPSAADWPPIRVEGVRRAGAARGYGAWDVQLRLDDVPRVDRLEVLATGTGTAWDDGPALSWQHGGVGEPVVFAGGRLS